jgi:hypothetical protein
MYYIYYHIIIITFISYIFIDLLIALFFKDSVPYKQKSYLIG